jgi:flavin-dependent dehydrogenase
VPETDIVIVGGGPAGTAAAIYAAQHGVRSILLEDRPNSDERPGETLHPGVVSLLRGLGVDEDVCAAAKIRHEGHWTDRAGRRRFVKFGADRAGPWCGLQIRRNDLRRIMVQRAMAQGVSLKHLRATRPVYRDSKICGVETPEGVISCRILIDASGGSHWLARAQREAITLFSPPLVVWYGWATSASASQFAAPIMTINDDSWSWVAQVDSNLCAWARLNFLVGGAVRLEKPPLLNGFDTVGRERGADVTWRTVAAHAGHGYFRVGDASAVLDPAASHGVLRALLTGIAAACCSVRVLKFGHTGLAGGYNRWVKKMLIRDARMLLRLYRHRPVIRR